MSAKDKVPHLAGMMPMMGQEIRKEFESLIKTADQADQTGIDFEEAEKLLNSIGEISGRIRELLARPGVATKTSNKTGGKKQVQKKKAGAKKAERPGKKTPKAPAKKDGRSKKDSPILPESEVERILKGLGFLSQDAPVLLGLLDTEHNYPEQADEARARAVKSLGFDPQKEKDRRHIGGRIARTRGKLFPRYIRKIAGGLTEENKKALAQAILPIAQRQVKHNISEQNVLEMMEGTWSQ